MKRKKFGATGATMTEFSMAVTFELESGGSTALMSEEFTIHEADAERAEALGLKLMRARIAKLSETHRVSAWVSRPISCMGKQHVGGRPKVFYRPHDFPESAA